MTFPHPAELAQVRADAAARYAARDLEDAPSFEDVVASMSGPNLWACWPSSQGVDLHGSQWLADRSAR